MTFIKLIQELSLMVKETPSPHYSKIAGGSTTDQTGSTCEVVKGSSKGSLRQSDAPQFVVKCVAETWHIWNRPALSQGKEPTASLQKRGTYLQWPAQPHEETRALLPSR